MKKNTRELKLIIKDFIIYLSFASLCICFFIVRRLNYLQVRLNVFRRFFVLVNCPLSFAINLTGAEGIYRKVVIVISVILSRPFGYGSLLTAERARLGLDSHSPWHWRSIVSPSKISSGSTCYKSSKNGDMAKKNEIVMKCQLSVYFLLSSNFVWMFEFDIKQYFRRHFK